MSARRSRKSSIGFALIVCLGPSGNENILNAEKTAENEEGCAGGLKIDYTEFKVTKREILFLPYELCEIYRC